MNLFLGVAQLAVTLNGPPRVPACEPIEIAIVVSATGSNLPTLVPPVLGQFEVLRATPVPNVRRSGNGLVAEYRYVLATAQSGDFRIPPFEARLGPQRARSLPLDLHVEQPVDASTAAVARARVDTSIDLSARPSVVPDTVFVGQQANYEVALFMAERVRERLRRNPTFYPPEMQGVLAYDIPTPREATRARPGSVCFDVMMYQRAVFPLIAGRIVIPPAQLAYAVPGSASFFSREETRELHTDSAVIIAIEPPSAGRPSDYHGAVGRLRVSARVDASRTRVGDPILYTVRVAGTGNVKLFPRPPLALSWASAVPADERVQIDSASRRVGGSKEFDWVLTPRVMGEHEISPLRYPHFDPQSARYVEASTNPVRVTVGAGALAPADTGRSEPILPIRRTYRGPLDPPIQDSPLFWLMLFVVPIPALAMGWRGRRRGRIRAASMSGARRDIEQSMADGHAQDARFLRRAFAAALAERLLLRAGTFERPGALTRALRRGGVSDATAAEAEALLRGLDRAAYSADRTISAGAAREAVDLLDRVDREALSRPELSVRASVLLLVVGAVCAGALASAQPAFARDEMGRRFSAAVDAYDRTEFAEARTAFATIARAEPRAPDAWANLGSASWLTADTANAIAAWQRALRLEPLALDMREWVGSAHRVGVMNAGYVMPLPSSAVFVAAAALWIVAWGSLVLRRGRPSWRRIERGAGVGAIVLLVFGVLIAEHLQGHGAAVVRASTELREGPRSDASSGAALTGEVVRTHGRDGAWTRVTLDGGRNGWMATDALIAIGARTTR